MLPPDRTCHYLIEKNTEILREKNYTFYEVCQRRTIIPNPS